MYNKFYNLLLYNYIKNLKKKDKNICKKNIYMNNLYE